MPQRGLANHESPPPKHGPDAGKPALRRPHPRRSHLPSPGNARQDALPHARRRTRLRCTEGKLQCAEAWHVRAGWHRRATAGSGPAGRRMEASPRDEVRSRVRPRQDMEMALPRRTVRCDEDGNEVVHDRPRERKKSLRPSLAGQRRRQDTASTPSRSRASAPWARRAACIRTSPAWSGRR